jgi:SCY1-like protein 1
MGNSASALPFTIGDETHPCTRAGSYGFSIHSGNRKADLVPVTVFKGQKSIMAKTSLMKGSSNNDPTLTQIFPALHHFSKIKTLVHPNMLRVYATLDTDFPNGNVNPDGTPAQTSTLEANPASLSALERTTTTGDLIIVTEPVIPLNDYLQNLQESTYLTDTQRQDAIAWGVHNLIQALTFLHNNAKVAHGNICPHAIFVTPGGDFKLSALHLLTPIGIADGATGPTPHFRHFERDVTSNEYRSPERIEGRWDAISTSPVHVMDSYSMGVLLPQLYSHPGAGTKGRIPQKLEKAAMRLRSPNLTRPRIAPLSKCPIFDTPHIHAQTFLDSIATESTESKISFWKSLPDLISRGLLSKNVARYKILPLLQSTITTLTSSDQGLTQEIHKRECLALLPTLFSTASANFSKEEYQEQMTPVIGLLFKVNDRAVRGALLSRMTLFSTMLDESSVNRVVFEPMCSGFTDSSPALRELTLKSAVVLVSFLTPANLEKLTRYLVRLQSDTEASIRTNTVIFIGKVVPNLSDMARSKMTLPAFTRAMKDPFHPCRLAGLKSICACREYFDEKALALEVLPAISPSLVDNVEEVRVEATRAIEELLVILKDVGERMREEERRRVLMGNSQNGSMPTTETTTTSSSSYLSGIGSWASSKISSSTQSASAENLSSKISSSTQSASADNLSSSGRLPFGSTMSQTKPSTTSKDVSQPTFSSLSLSDANIGGNAGGWSDDEFDHAAPVATSSSKNLIPAFATDVEDDFMSEFGKSNTLLKNRQNKSSKLNIPNGNKSKIVKGSVKKLSLDEEGLDDGWDDF